MKQHRDENNDEPFQNEWQIKPAGGGDEKR
jgi:hypothetical protein